MSKFTKQKLFRFGAALGLLLLCVTMTVAQTKTVTGKVVDETGQPVIGAAVRIQGASTGTITDVDGNFSISASAKDVLNISFIGYTSQTIPVGSKSSIDVTLKESSTQLNEVVAVGYGTQRKANLTGAVATVDVGKALTNKSFTDIGKGLQGTVPGLQITYSNGDMTAAPTIQLRGITSLTGGTNKTPPLILVDGIAVLNQDITSIDQNNIASISVLKDAASTSIFGTRAVGGVIMITTKSGQKNTKFSVTYSNNFSWGNPTVLPTFADPLQEIPMEDAAAKRAGNPMGFDFWGGDKNDMLTGIANWKQNYAGTAKGDNMVMGRDFEIKGTIPTFYRIWDPVKIMYQTMPAQNHNINFSGGTDKLSYYVSGSYSYKEGLLKPNPEHVNTYNLTASITADVTKWLTMQAKMTDRQYNWDGPFVSSGLIGSDPLYYMWRWGSYQPYGTYTDPASGQTYYWDSPYGFLKTAGTSTAQNNTITSNLSATIKFTPWLNLHSDFSYIYGSTLGQSYGGPTPMWDFWLNPWTGSPAIYNPIMKNYLWATNSAGDFYSTTFNKQITSNTFLTFEKKFGTHNLKAIAGLNLEKGESTGVTTGGYNLIDPSTGEVNFLLNTDPYGNPVRYVGSGLGQPAYVDLTKYPYIGGTHTWWSTAGYFARVNYDYNNKYLIELNARYDGSSSFPISGRWAFFPSASAGWRVTEEPFMKDLKKDINDWKIRISYGTLGNALQGTNYFLPTMANGTTNFLTQSGRFLPYVGLPQNVPASLTWERVNTLDVGTDMRFLDNNLGLTFDWFRKENVGMLTSGAVLPQTFGAGAARTNNGNMRTDGWELGVDYHYQFKNGIQIYANAGISNAVSKIIAFIGNETKTLNNYYVGETVGEIWGFQTVGYFKDAADVANSPDQSKLQSGTFVFGPGDIKYADLKPDGVIDWGKLTATDHGDLKKIGNSLPQYQYSFRVGGSWKGFDLDAYFQGIGKHDGWATGNVAIPGYGGNGAFLGNQMEYTTVNVDGILNPTTINMNAKWPNPYYGNNVSNIPSETWWSGSAGTSGNNFYPQTKYLLNMSYLRLKTLQVGYTLPAQLTEKIGIQRFRIYAEGMNLLTFSPDNLPIDPEITSGASSFAGYYGITSPFNRTYSFGVQLTF